MSFWSLGLIVLRNRGPLNAPGVRPKSSIRRWIARKILYSGTHMDQPPTGSYNALRVKKQLKWPNVKGFWFLCLSSSLYSSFESGPLNPDNTSLFWHLSSHHKMTCPLYDDITNLAVIWQTTKILTLCLQLLCWKTNWKSTLDPVLKHMFYPKYCFRNEI